MSEGQRRAKERAEAGRARPVTKHVSPLVAFASVPAPRRCSSGVSQEPGEGIAVLMPMVAARNRPGTRGLECLDDLQACCQRPDWHPSRRAAGWTAAA